MTNDDRPPGRPRPQRASGSVSASGSGPAGRGGSGKNGKTKLRDVSGWAKTRYAVAKTLKWMAILGLVGALVTGVAVYVTYKMIDIPDPNTDFEAQTSTVYYADGKHVLGQFALQNRQSINLADMPKPLQDAVISAEDRSFESNSGIDFKGVVRAAWTNLRSDEVEQGASTITQQYVKVLYLSQERTYQRKIKEAFLAVKLQNQLTKEQILEGYLNTIYFGRGAYGIQAAAQAYFDRDAKDLNVPESAFLAAVINSPGNYDPANGKQAKTAVKYRYDYVLNGMVEMGNLDADQAARYERRLPKFPKIEEINAYGGQKGYLMTLVRSQLEAEGFTDEEIEGGGLKVVTTFDWDMERAAGQTIKAIRPEGRKQLHVALSSVEPGTGALRAMIGGRNYLESQINWALNGGQPGSAFKPYALAAGLRDGFTLQSTFDGNSPYTYPNGETVRNEGESSGVPDGFSYGSAVTLTTATQKSINTAYADLTSSMDNGPTKVIDAAVSAGVPRDSAGLEPNLGVALGSATIPNVDMANGYATFAANGRHSDWYVIQKVTDASGLRFEHTDKANQVFSPAIASNVSYALQQVVEGGTGASALELGRPAAGKTGTATAVFKGTQHVSSSWFVGYTPQLSTAVMYVRGDGNDPLDGGYLDPFFGGSYPTQTWTAYMKRALQGTPVKDFPDPAPLLGQSPTPVPPTTFAPTTTYAPTTSQQPTTTTPTPTTTTPTTTTTTTTPTTTEPTTSSVPTTTPKPTSSPPTTSSAPTTKPTSSPPSTGSPPTTTAPTTTAPTVTQPPTTKPKPTKPLKPPP